MISPPLNPKVKDHPLSSVRDAYSVYTYVTQMHTYYPRVYAHKKIYDYEQ